MTITGCPRLLERMLIMAVWKLKSCPRCSGDLFIQRETDGWYEECLLCGYQRDISGLVTVGAGGRVTMKVQPAQGQKLYSKVRISPAN